MPNKYQNPVDPEGGNLVAHDDAAAPELKETRSWFGLPEKNTPAEQFVYAKQLEKEGRITRARKAYNALVHQWAESPEAAKAQLGVAALYEMGGNLPAAFREDQYYVDNYASGEEADGASFDDIIATQFSIATTLRLKMNGGWFSSPGVVLVTSMFHHIVENAPDWYRAPECMMLEASAFESEKMYQDAIPIYEKIVSRYPYSDLKIDARYRAATCRYLTSRQYPRDERTLKNALASLMNAYREKPTHEMGAVTSKRIAELSANLTAMNFEKAEFYDRIRRNPQAAILAYNEFLSNFPTASEAPKAEARVKEIKAQLHAAPISGK